MTKDEAAPVQEPALVIYQGEIARSNLPKGFTGMLYTTPPAAKRPWVELTDEEINGCIKFPGRNLLSRDGTTSQRIARAIEAKLKEKNT